MTRKASRAVHDRRSSAAVELFEKALRAIARKDHARAKELLHELLEHKDAERDVLERARAYLLVCERARDKRAFKPKTFEELLNYGVFLHNKGEFEEALKYLREAAEIHPRNENVQYCLAAAAARAGDTGAALKALRSAIEKNPANRTQARSDSDFDPIRDDEEFVSLVFPQAS